MLTTHTIKEENQPSSTAIQGKTLLISQSSASDSKHFALFKDAGTKKPNHADILALVGGIFKSDHPDLLTIISQYLFVCDHPSNHMHALQDNVSYFENLTQFETATDALYIALNKIKNPVYKLVLGGGTALTRSYDTAYRPHEDSDFVIIHKQDSAQSIDAPLCEHEQKEFANLKKSIRDELKTLPFPITKEFSINLNGIVYFTFDLGLALNHADTIIEPSLKVSFVYLLRTPHLAMSPLKLLHSPTVPLANLATMNLIEILAGKVISLIARDEVFHTTKLFPKTVKNFFDIYMVIKTKKIAPQSPEFMTAIKHLMELGQKIYKGAYDEFADQPLKKFAEALSALQNDVAKFGEQSELAKEYNSYVNKEVYHCESHVFSDTVKVLIDVISSFLIFSKYESQKAASIQLDETVVSPNNPASRL